MAPTIMKSRDTTRITIQSGITPVMPSAPGESQLRTRAA